jgi:hypothetical protein
VRACGERKVGGLGWVASGGKKREGRWAGWAEREKGRGERGLGILFLNSFQIHFSNIQTSLKQETMHSNHDAQALVISNIIEMMFKYLETNLLDNLIMSLRKN